MVTPDDIKGWITEKLPCDHIELDGRAIVRRCLALADRVSSQVTSNLQHASCAGILRKKSGMIDSRERP